MQGGHTIYSRRACNLCKKDMKDIQFVQEGHTICVISDSFDPRYVQRIDRDCI